MQELGLKQMGNFARKNGETCHNACGMVLSNVAAFNKQSIKFCKHKTWRERSI
jgi:hypothetical protein